MILRGATIVGDDRGPVDIHVSAGKIGRIDGAREGDTIVFPGLFNSHDHLEFNLYPQLGHERYADYVEWGHDIQRRDAEIISAIERVPRSTRAGWGELKNLLGGVTAVAHHGADGAGADPVLLTALRGCAIHSVRFGGRWRWRLNGLPNRSPYVVHVGEGTSARARDEVSQIQRWNLFRRDLIAVHAVAMTGQQAARFRAVVWCPVSNEFLYGATADVRSIKTSSTVLLGTDSTLTADWNIWNHLRRARAIGALTDQELFAAVTGAAADVWTGGVGGRIAPGQPADLVVARRKAKDPWEAFFATDPEDLLLVLRGGVVLLADGAVADVTLPPGHSTLRVGGRQKRVAMDVARWLSELAAHGVTPNLDLALSAP